MRDPDISKQYWTSELGFKLDADYGDYLIFSRDQVEVHLFMFRELDPRSNYGQIYLRCTNIEQHYKELLDKGVKIHPNGPLELKPWGQLEFSLLDPDGNLITIGQSSE